MKDFKKYYILPVPPEEVYLALTNPLTIELWSGEKAEMSTEPGTEFSLWDGSIVGRNLEFETGKKIVQQWYFGEQQEPSIVTIRLHTDPRGTSTTLTYDALGSPLSLSAPGVSVNTTYNQVDDPRAIAVRDHAWKFQRAIGAAAAADIGRVDARCLQPDPDFAGAGHRRRPLTIVENLSRRSATLIPDGAHPTTACPGRRRRRAGCFAR